MDWREWRGQEMGELLAAGRAFRADRLFRGVVDAQCDRCPVGRVVIHVDERPGEGVLPLFCPACGTEMITESVELDGRRLVNPCLLDTSENV